MTYAITPFLLGGLLCSKLIFPNVMLVPENYHPNKMVEIASQNCFPCQLFLQLIFHEFSIFLRDIVKKIIQKM